jgi:membrane-bound acyltransferase YfiQ involved in biofilm formation
MQPSDRRFRAISLLELSLCALVVFIHVASDAIENGAEGNAFTVAILYLQQLMSFAMPGFVFASALKTTLARTRRGNGIRGYARFLGVRVRRVCVPYVLWVAVYYCFFVYARYFSFSLRDLVGYILRGDLVAHFYFVLVIMQFYLLAPAIEAAAEKSATATLLSSLALTIVGAFLIKRHTLFPAYLLYWTLGVCAALNYERVCAFLTRRRTAILCGGAVFAAVFLYVSRFYMAHPTIIETVWIVFRAATPLALFTLTLAFEHRGGERFNRAVDRLHSAAFYIYLSHPLALFAVMRFIPSDTSTPTRFLLRVLAGYLPPAALSVAYCAAKRKIRISRELLP